MVDFPDSPDPAGRRVRRKRGARGAGYRDGPRRSILHSFLSLLESSSNRRSIASDRAFSALSWEEMQLPMALRWVVGTKGYLEWGIKSCWRGVARRERREAPGGKVEGQLGSERSCLDERGDCFVLTSMIEDVTLSRHVSPLSTNAGRRPMAIGIWHLWMSHS